jgi:pectinesterase
MGAVTPVATNAVTLGRNAARGEIGCRPAQRTITVALDGSAQFTSIGAALDSVPEDNAVPTLLSIRNGTYHERVALTNRGFITFHGEDRVKTRIEFEVATSFCTEPSSGCSVVLIDGDDIGFDNLTIANTWAGEKKAVALRTTGGSTRIVLQDVELAGQGGDTLILEENGEYYLSRVSVSGTYHIVVPRGTTWVSDSTFTCLGNPICLFNEGIESETQKLVIRHSVIQGSAPFGLGSYFRDAAWYFVDDTFSANMMDKPIWRNPPAAPYSVLWGERVYFAGSKGPGYEWLKDNIDASPAKTKKRVTVAWTFPDWNPSDSLVCAEARALE